VFTVRSQNCEKRLSVSPLLSVLPHETRFTLNGILRNLIFGYVQKIRQENSNLVEI